MPVDSSYWLVGLLKYSNRVVVVKEEKVPTENPSAYLQ